jgi:hypothetical protein
MLARVTRDQRLQQMALLLSLERLADVQVPPLKSATSVVAFALTSIA